MYGADWVGFDFLGNGMGWFDAEVEVAGEEV